MYCVQQTLLASLCVYTHTHTHTRTELKRPILGLSIETVQPNVQPCIIYNLIEQLKLKQIVCSQVM